MKIPEGIFLIISMDNQEKMLAKMREIALQNPENIRIIETSVNSETQIEFFEALQDVDENVEEINYTQLFEDLNNEDTSLDEKKNILTLLTTMGEVEAFRMLEEYLKTVPEELKNWAFLACQQGRMFLESRLLEESKIYIASGLGGKDFRLRYFFALSGKDEILTDSQQNIIKGELEYFLKKSDSIIEEIKFEKSFITSIALIPIYEDLVELIQEIVHEINQYGGFLKDNVFITNEKLVGYESLGDIFDEE